MTALLTARDRRAVTGRNCALLTEETRLNIWMENKTKVKEVLAEKEKTKVPLGEEWRVDYLSKRLEQRQTVHYRGMVEEEKRLSGLINSLCIN